MARTDHDLDVIDGERSVHGNGERLVALSNSHRYTPADPMRMLMHRWQLVLIARLVPGTRAVVFVTAGGGRIGNLGKAVDWLERAGALVLLIAGVLLLAWLWLGREESKL